MSTLAQAYATLAVDPEVSDEELRLTYYALLRIIEAYDLIVNARSNVDESEVEPGSDQHKGVSKVVQPKQKQKIIAYEPYEAQFKTTDEDGEDLYVTFNSSAKHIDAMSKREPRTKKAGRFYGHVGDLHRTLL
ncbi:hypothetical protein LTS08_000387 [Lithohypha guttulata]|nr:hypothetical protein LTS08_000387 [Lithohypha guttulata]